MRKLLSRLQGRKVLAFLLLLVGAGLLAPRFFKAERYRTRLASGLDRALGRPVSFGAISFHLLPRPGFSIENAVIPEDPAFGAEPFARADRIDCDLRFRSLLGPGLEISRLFLERPSFNAVRNSDGHWNLQSLWPRKGSSSSAPAGDFPGRLQIEMDDARVDFKAVLDKKPFAITGVSAQFSLDRTRDRVTYRLVGSPIRTDLALPTPGQFELKGEWTLGADFAGPLDATLETQSAMLYDWVPVVTGRNPEIYGLADASVHLTGSLRNLVVEGRTRLTQLHRSDQPPPSETLNSEIYFRGRYDQAAGRMLLDSVDASFADSRVHLSGSVDDLFGSPVLDLVIAVERSHLEDFQAMVGRFTPQSAAWNVSGRVDALVTIQGSWTERRYGGFVDISSVRLTTPTGTFPVSEIKLRIDKEGAQLAPVKLTLSPRVELVAEGKLFRASPRKEGTGQIPLQYTLSLSAKLVPLHELLRLARGLGVKAAEGVDAQGTASTAFTLGGTSWPLAPPVISGRLDLHAARLLIPGLTEPLNLPKALIQVRNKTITAFPVVAVIGTSVFTGRLTHQGERSRPWNFDVWANSLSVEQGALWFDVLGNRAPVPLLERLPGLRSGVERRAAASSLFTALNASGRFSTPKLTYRALILHDFQAAVEMGGRVVLVNGATFRAGGGRGAGRAVVNLKQSPAQVVADFDLAGARLQPLAPYLPAPAQKIRGSYSASGHFETLGLSRGEITDNLRGQASLRLRDVSFSDFDPIQVLARASREGYFEPAHLQATVRTASLKFEVSDRRVAITSSWADISGAQVRLDGTCAFDGTLDMSVQADLRRHARQWNTEGGNAGPGAERLALHLGGTLKQPVLEPAQELSRAKP